MSVPAQVPISGPYTANGVTTQFAYKFYLLFATDMQVFVGGQKKILNTDYSVTGVGNSQGGNVVFITPPGNGLEVLIRRVTPYTRQTDYADNGDLLADVVNDDFDRIWLALQEINASFSSSISKPVGGNWDAQSLRITNVSDGTQPQDVATVNQLNVVNDSAGQSAKSAANSAAAAKTSETNSASSQQAAAASASAAATSAGNSSDSATLAQKWAANPVGTEVAAGKFSALHYASKASDSATSASGSAGSASTSAGNASVSASAAAQSATSAKSDADRAQSANPDNQLKKANNLSDVNSASQAWKTLVDGRTAITARSDLGLGTLSTKSSVSRTELDVENFRNLFAAGATPTNAGGAGVWQYDNSAWGFGEQYGTTIQVNNRKDTSGAAGGGIWHHYLGLTTSGNLLYAVNINGNYASYKMWSTKNTAVDGSGFIKQASPIARVVSEIENAPPSLTDGFELAGSGAVNNEAEGVTIQRVESGVYRISGCSGLHDDGWQIEVPKDINGNRLCFTSVDYAGDDLILHVYKPRLDLDTGGIIAGASMDIPPGRWIDLRLNMPEDSIYKRKQREFAPSPSDIEQVGAVE